MSKEVEEGTVEGLRESAKVIGHGYPIIEDKFGKIVDGFHRNDADQNWPRHRDESIDTPLKRELARFHLNFWRRPISPSEKSFQLDRIQEEAFKQYGRYLTIDELVKFTKFSKRWIYQYLPDRYKEGPAGRPKEEFAKSANSIPSGAGQNGSALAKETTDSTTPTPTRVTNSSTQQISLDDYIDTGIVVSCPECSRPLTVLQNKNDKKDYLAQAFSGVAKKAKKKSKSS